jgi:hypothetical protein
MAVLSVYMYTVVKMRIVLTFLLTSAMCFDLQCQEREVNELIFSIMREDSINLASMNLQGLRCALKYEKLRSRAYSILSFIYLQRRNYKIAFSYATRSSNTDPKNTLSYYALSILNHRTNTWAKSHFYLEVASAIETTLNLPFEISREREEIMQQGLNALLYVSPEWQNHENLFIRNIARQISQSSSLYDAYKSLQFASKTSRRGLSIVAMEDFLHIGCIVINCPSTLLYPAAQIIHYPFYHNQDVISSSEFCVKWPTDKAFVLQFELTQIGIFGETMVALSDALSRLGIQHRISLFPSHINSTNEIIIHTSINLTKLEGYNHIVWNFEKNPTVTRAATEDDDAGRVNFMLNSCQRDIAKYPFSYINTSISYWESIPSALYRWATLPDDYRGAIQRGKGSTVPYLVPSFIPNNIILLEKIIQRFDGLIFYDFNCILLY